MTAPQDDPWRAAGGRTDRATDASWLSRLVALEDEAHEDTCCTPEEGP